MDDRQTDVYSQLRDWCKRFANSETGLSHEFQESYEAISGLIEEMNQADDDLRGQYEALHLARQRLEQERERYQDLFDFAPDAYLVTDPQGRILEANQAAAAMFHVRTDVLVGKPLKAYMDRAEWERFIALMQQIEQVKSVEVAIQPRDHSSIIVEVHLARIMDKKGHMTGLRWLLRDITERKRVETDLEEMRRRLQGSGEAERLHLAQEIHDGPMQDLYGTVFKLTIAKTLIDDPELKDTIQEVEAAIKGVASNLRTVCGELRPPTLTNLGLERTIRSHAEKFQELHPELIVHLNLQSDGDSLPEEIRLLLFRVYQQSMMNILRHAQAKTVIIRFWMEGERVYLIIQDDGKGFELPEKWVELLRQGSYGLAGMYERVQVFGGELKIESKPGEGTMVKVIVPKP